MLFLHVPSWINFRTGVGFTENVVGETLRGIDSASPICQTVEHASLNSRDSRSSPSLHKQEINHLWFIFLLLVPQILHDFLMNGWHPCRSSHFNWCRFQSFFACYDFERIRKIRISMCNGIMHRWELKIQDICFLQKCESNIVFGNYGVWNVCFTI